MPRGGPKVFLVTQGDKQRLVQATKTLEVIKFLAADVRIQELTSVEAAQHAQTLKLEKAAA